MSKTISPTSLSTPSSVRHACRDQILTGPTAGYSPGHAQGNLCILPAEYAFDFLLFCQRNPKSCPLLHVLEKGQWNIPGTDVDIRTDLPRYRIYYDGELKEEVLDVSTFWREDLVTFVIGCSFSFEEALIGAGLRVRHIDEQRNVPMYNTNRECQSAGMFSGNMVVSMRPYPPHEVATAVQITSRYPRVHGAPVHIGDPASLGISDINRPDYGESVTIKDGEIPVFWACGVTPQAIVMKSRPNFCITHAPGHMLILDETNDSLTL